MRVFDGQIDGQIAAQEAWAVRFRAHRGGISYFLSQSGRFVVHMIKRRYVLYVPCSLGRDRGGADEAAGHALAEARR